MLSRFGRSCPALTSRILLALGLITVLLAMHAVAGADVSGATSKTGAPTSTHALMSVLPDNGSVDPQASSLTGTSGPMAVASMQGCGGSISMQRCAAIIGVLGLLLLAAPVLRVAPQLPTLVVRRRPTPRAPAALLDLHALAVLRI